MKQHGRKSQHDVAVVVGNFGKRPTAPDYLSEREQQVWNKTVNGEHADLFSSPASQMMLENYCRHQAESVELSERIAALKSALVEGKAFIDDYERLLRLRDRETRSAAALASRLRLTNQSRQPSTSPILAKENIATATRRPWDRQSS